MPLVSFWCMFHCCCAALVAVLLQHISRWLLKLPLCGRRCRCVATSGWCTLLGRIMRAVLACRRPNGRALAATAAMESEVAHAAFWHRNWRRGQQHGKGGGGHRDRRSTASRFKLRCSPRSQSASLQRYLRRFAFVCNNAAVVVKRSSASRFALADIGPACRHQWAAQQAAGGPPKFANRYFCLSFTSEKEDLDDMVVRRFPFVCLHFSSCRVRILYQAALRLLGLRLPGSLRDDQ